MAVRADGAAGERAAIQAMREHLNCRLYQVDGIGRYNDGSGRRILIESKSKSHPVNMTMYNDGVPFIGSGIDRNQLLTRFDMIKYEFPRGLRDGDFYLYFLDNSTPPTEYWGNIMKLCTESQVRKLKNHGDGNDVIRLFRTRYGEWLVIFNYAHFTSFELSWEKYDERIEPWGKETEHNCLRINSKNYNEFTKWSTSVRDMKDGNLFLCANNEENVEVLNKIFPIEYICKCVEHMTEIYGSHERACDILFPDNPNLANSFKNKIRNIYPDYHIK